MRKTLIFLEKLIPCLGTILILIANILMFVRNDGIITLGWLWAVVTSDILLGMLFIAFFLAHGLWVVTQPDFERGLLKNKLSIAAAFV